MGINSDSVRSLVEAQRRGVGTTNYKTIGRSPKEVERKFRTNPRARAKWYNLYGLLVR